MYGLNRRRSFLTLPRGNKIRLDSPEDITNFARKTLKEKLCETALFFVYLDGTYSSVFKVMTSDDHEKDVLEEDDELTFTLTSDICHTLTYAICQTGKSKDSHMFSELDGDFRFCCYSLLVEVKNGVFEVCR